MMKTLYPTFPETTNYRGKMQNKENRPTGRQLEELKGDILKRDEHTCQYCGFEASEYQTVNYADGDPSNNKRGNMVTACPMCFLILNTAVGCKVEGIVELYESSRFPQQKIIQITRKMRAEGKGDAEIIRFLGLKDKVPFKSNREYLRKLYGFVTSWKGSWGGMEEALAFGYSH